MKTTQYEVTVILPTTDKRDGSDMTSTVEELATRIYAITGGLSMWPQVGYEVWEDAVYRDPAQRIATVTSSTAEINHIRNVALDAIELLHQRGGVFFQVIGDGHVVVEFLDRDDSYLYDHEYNARLQERVAA